MFFVGKLTCCLFNIMGALGDIRPHVQSLVELIITEPLKSKFMVTSVLFNVVNSFTLTPITVEHLPSS